MENDGSKTMIVNGRFVEEGKRREERAGKEWLRG